MRIVLVLIAATLLLGETGGIDSTPSEARVDFESQLKPIFKAKCMPCHFSGGQVYDRLPFDRPETIRKLGTKLFTRIKDENVRRLIEELLAKTP